MAGLQRRLACRRWRLVRVQWVAGEPHGLDDRTRQDAAFQGAAARSMKTLALR